MHIMLQGKGGTVYMQKYQTPRLHPLTAQTEDIMDASGDKLEEDYFSIREIRL